MNSDNPENENGLSAKPGTEELKPESREHAAPAVDEIESAAPDVGVNETESPPLPANGRGKARGGGSLLAVFAFLFSIVALAGSAWMWWQDQASGGQEEERVFTEIARLESADSELSLKLNQIRDQVDSQTHADLTAEFTVLQRRLEADRSQMDSVEQTIREQVALSRSLQAAANSMQGRLQAAEAAVAGMSTRELDAGGELDLAEVDYLLRLGNERLQLFLDPAAADQALEVADMHLAALDNPMYLGVRQDIAVARRDLAAVDIPDYLEIARELDVIQEAIPSLSFRGSESVSPESAAATEEGWWEKLKGAFSGLVTVRRSTEDESDRISIEDKDFIRQRVWLQLEIAHLSLMRRDQEAFRNSLERAQNSMTTWFEPESREYQAVSSQMEALLDTEIDVATPDITAPWSTLRLIRNGQARPAAQALPVVDEASAEELSEQEPVDKPEAETLESESVADEAELDEIEPEDELE